MSLMEASPEGYFQEIIKLQLKKPKSWNWQLSTSKSSPHIALPVIQLYDSKGQLVLEAKDNGKAQRRSWHSSNIRPKETTTTNIKKGYKEPTERHLQRCRSDILESDTRKNCSANKLDSIKRRETQKSSNNKLTNNSGASLDNSIGRESADVTNENRKSKGYNENPIKGEDVKYKRNLNDLKKSRSDVLEFKGNSRLLESLKRNSFRPIRSDADFVENKGKNELPCHRRSRSDDLLRRKLKCNEESLKRAEIDGYKNFIFPYENWLKAIEKNKAIVTTDENVLLSNNTSNVEVPHFRHNRYKTRTCSAGTLIITEESFNNCHRRRRRRDASIENSNNAQNNAGPYSKDTIENTERTSLHVRQGNHPTNLATDISPREMKQPENRYGTQTHNYINYPEKNRLQENGIGKKKVSESASARLFYSRSDIFPFEKTLNNKVNKKCDDNCNYIVQEPVTSGSDNNKIGKNSQPVIIEKLEKKKRRKVRRRYSDVSTSPCALEKKYQHKRKGNDTKGL